MKKLIICLFAFFTMISHANAKRIEILRRGSKDGIHYNKVQESHNLFVDRLSCTDPGNVGCGWVKAPMLADISVEVMENWVISQVQAGVVSGETKYNGLVFVKWTYDAMKDELFMIFDDGKI